jgi:DNA-binding NarL/FixJ family response regulator
MSPPFSKRSAILVDQHPLWIDTLEQVVNQTNVEVLRGLSSSRQALEALDDLMPDLLITGIAMPAGEIDGIELIRAAREQTARLKVIVLSMYGDSEHIHAAFAAGADAYVLKTAHPDDIRSAVRQVFDQSIYLANPVPSSCAPVARKTSPDASAGLTRRETEILRLVAEGHSNLQLARMLWVTEQTVKFHLSNIYRKLDVSNRTEASRWAQVQGLLPSPVLRAAAP